MNWQVSLERAALVFGGAVRILRVTVAHPTVAAAWHTAPPTSSRAWELAGLWALACTVIAIVTGAGLSLRPDLVVFVVVAFTVESAVRAVAAHMVARLIGGTGQAHAVLSVFATLIPAIGTAVVAGVAVFALVEINAVFYLALVVPTVVVVPVLIGNLAAVHELRVHRATLALVVSWVLVGGLSLSLVQVADRTMGPEKVNRLLLSPQENEADAIHRCIESGGGSTHLPGVYDAAHRRMNGEVIHDDRLRLSLARTVRCLKAVEPHFRRTTAMHASARTLIDALERDNEPLAVAVSLLDYLQDYNRALALW